MTNEVRSAQELAEHRESTELYARQRSLEMAHSDAPTKDVIERATAYYKFIIDEKSA